MENAKAFEVNSLSEYISVIEKYPHIEYMYRGEKSIFSERISSALRPYDGRWQSKKEFPFINMLEEYYYEVGHNLKNVEMKNFIAFAQHHGIPTNLIDVTSSPLVALFFACEKDEDKQGCVYAMRNNCIDITKVIERHPNENVIDVLVNSNPKVMLEFVPLFDIYIKNNEEKFKECLHQLLKDFNYYFYNSSVDITELYNRFDKDIEKIDFYELFSLLDEDDKSVLSSELDKYNIMAITYVCLVRKFFILAKQLGEVIYWINFLPNLLYKPLMTFERGRKQSGSFIYQAYLSYIENEYSYRVLMKQRVKYDVMVHINNKEEILKSLDNIGFNKKTLFGDFDSIAKYIREKNSWE